MDTITINLFITLFLSPLILYKKKDSSHLLESFRIAESGLEPETFGL